MKNTHMKTSVELAIDKVETAKRLGNASTLKELLDRALDAYIAQARRHSMAALLGSGFSDVTPSQLRRDRGRSSR